MVGRVVTIDGPSASGKSTAARRVALALGYLHVDSGSLYRAVAWACRQGGCASTDASAVARTVASLTPRFFVADGSVRFRLDGVDPGPALRSESVTREVSAVSAVPAVRRRVGAWLREMPRLGDVVVEGRDIGTAVFPGASCKFYLDATPEERARRRHAESAGDGDSTLTGTQASIEQRDRLDSTRAMDTLRAAEDAVVIDTTGMTADQVAATIVSRCRGVGVDTCAGE